MKISLVSLVITAGTLAWPVLGVAQVPFFGAQKTNFYEQKVNDKVPTKAYSHSLDAFVTVDKSRDAKKFTLSAVKTVTFKRSGKNFGKSIFFKTLTDLNKEFPVGDAYTFTVVGGSLNGEFGALPIEADAFPQVPYLLGAELTELQNLSADSTVTLNIGYGDAGATSTAVTFAIFDTTGQIYLLNGSAGTTSFVIPSSEISQLATGVKYTGQLTTFNTSEVTSTGSFTTAANSDGWCSSTNFTIEVQ
jgi:hypothetical protein